MSVYQIDTGGKVATPDGFYTVWDDLSPFARGYIEAMLTPCEALHFSLTDRFAGFSDLAPESLARIIADCGPDPQGYLYPTSARMGYAYTFEGGRKFWSDRQSGVWADFPPLSVTLGDDGKVRFAKAAITRADGGAS